MEPSDSRPGRPTGIRPRPKHPAARGSRGPLRRPPGHATLSPPPEAGPRRGPKQERFEACGVFERSRLSENAASDREPRTQMIKVQVRPNEPLEAALRRFKRQCNFSGIFRLAKKSAYYEKPSDRRRR